MDGESHPSIFEFQPLSDAQHEIRLFRILPGKNGDGQDNHIHCSMKTTRLADAAHTYAAISYTWGSPGIRPGRCVFVNGKSLKNPRHHLWYALCQMRRHDLWQWYWMDGLCINQDDEEEKAKQVGIMHRIYGGAACTAACVASDDTMLEELRKAPEHQNIDVLQRQTAQLAHTSYMERLWIIQEIVLAPSVRLFCGSESVSWELLNESAILSTQPGPLAQLLTYRRTLRQSASSASNTAPLSVFGASVEGIAGDDIWSAMLRDMFMAFGQAKCQNPLDKIYGLVPMAYSCLPDQSGSIAIDYTRSKTDLALHLLTLWMDNGDFWDRWSCALKLATELDLQSEDVEASTATIWRYGHEHLFFRWDAIDDRNISVSGINELPQTGHIYCKEWQAILDKPLRASYGELYDDHKSLFQTSLKYLCYIKPNDNKHKSDPVIAVTAFDIRSTDRLLSMRDIDIYAILRPAEDGDVVVVGTAWRCGEGLQRVNSYWFPLESSLFRFTPTSRPLDLLRVAIAQHQGTEGFLVAAQEISASRPPLFCDLARQLNFRNRYINGRVLGM